MVFLTSSATVLGDGGSRGRVHDRWKAWYRERRFGRHDLKYMPTHSQQAVNSFSQSSLSHTALLGKKLEVHKNDWENSVMHGLNIVLHSINL